MTDNSGNLLREIRHADLTRTQDSVFRSLCPVCGTGVLFVRRDMQTLELQEMDNCTGCGQAFQYIDIAVMRKNLDGR